MDGEHTTQDPKVSLYEDTYEDLMAVARLTRRDHRDVLRDAVEAIRTRVEPKLSTTVARPGRKPKAAS